MSKTPSTLPASSQPTNVHRSLRALRRCLDYQLLILMIRLGLVQPAQVRARAHR